MTHKPTEEQKAKFESNREARARAKYELQQRQITRSIEVADEMRQALVDAGLSHSHRIITINGTRQIQMMRELFKNTQLKKLAKVLKLAETDYQDNPRIQIPVVSGLELENIASEEYQKIVEEVKTIKGRRSKELEELRYIELDLAFRILDTLISALTPNHNFRMPNEINDIKVETNDKLAVIPYHAVKSPAHESIFVLPVETSALDTMIGEMNVRMEYANTINGLIGNRIKAFNQAITIAEGLMRTAIDTEYVQFAMIEYTDYRPDEWVKKEYTEKIFSDSKKKVIKATQRLTSVESDAFKQMYQFLTVTRNTTK